MRKAVLLLLALVLPAATAGAAERSFPGRNGAIVFASDRGDALAPKIFAIRADGRGRTNLSAAGHTELFPLPSPDGRRIAFLRTVEGELWAMDADGGGKRLLARNARGGSWSPDGSRLAFVEAGQVATVSSGGGEPHLLVGGAAPQWSPAGDWIAFASGPDLAQLWLVRPDGTGLHRLAASLGERGIVFAWRPDGAALAYVDRGARATPTDLGALRIVGVDGSGERALTSGLSIDSQPGWSPDGRRLAFVTGGELRTVGADGTGGARLAGAASVATPAWSRDGSLIAFGGLSPNDPVAGQIRVVRPDGSGLRTVTHEAAHFKLVTGIEGGVDGGPAWTSDGRILYAGWLVNNDRDLYLARGDGSVRALTGDDFDETDPEWSPDGETIAFTRRLTRVESEVYAVGADGKGLRRLTRHAGDDASPAWSPDGSRIAFARRAGAGVAIATMRADGSRVRLLTGGRTRDGEPAWSPDGRQIAFVRDPGRGDAAKSLFVMAADGTHVRRVAAAPGAVHVQWSPDGATLAVGRVTSCGVQCTEPGLWLVPAAGGPAREILGGGLDAAWSPDGHALAVGLGGDIRVVSPRGAGLRRVATAAGTDEMPDWQPLCTRSGGAAADRIAGTAGADVLCGRGGGDRIVGGPGRDRIFGGPGNDSIDARDGAFDVVGCGSGRDTVRADPVDLVGADCERRG